MYKPTDRQMPLLGTDVHLAAPARARLQRSWAPGFRKNIIPVLLAQEPLFEGLYGETGRPNWSVARMLGVMVLQEMFDLSDQDALDSLSFDARWQHALELDGSNAYLSRRSLVAFRSRLVAHDPEMTRMREVFQAIGKQAISDLDISVRQQRIDSTHVVSNIRSRGLLDLFKQTLLVFLRHLKAEHSDRFKMLPEALCTWFSARTEANGDAWDGVGSKPQDLQQLAVWIHSIQTSFSEDEAVRDCEPYGVLVRLFQEHCVVEPPGDDDPEPDGEPSIRIKKKSDKPGLSLQSAHDPDAGFSPQKGVGYSAQIVETCGNGEKPEIITTFEVHSAGMRDFGQTAPAVERLEKAGLKPAELIGDSHYVSGGLILSLKKREIELLAPAGRGQLRRDLVGRDQFKFDEAGELTACPMGHAPVGHVRRTSSSDRKEKMHAQLDESKCGDCPLQGRCVARRPNSGKGRWRIDIEADLRARDQNLADQQTDEWRRRYRIRSGIEATNSELKRRHGLGVLRVRRLPRVKLAVVNKLMACNVKRWLAAA